MYTVFGLAQIKLLGNKRGVKASWKTEPIQASVCENLHGCGT